MTLRKTFFATGTVAALASGGLFLTATPAAAAPGDAACLAAEAELRTALEQAGLEAELVDQLEGAVDAVVTAQLARNTLAQAALDAAVEL
ncbi:hypothetical protein ACFP5Z_14945, partial [Kocuria oceani]